MEKKEKFIKELLEEVLRRLGVTATVSVVPEEDRFKVEILSENLGLLIGYHGEVLSSLQLFLSLAAYNKFGEWVSLIVDAGGYRKEREERLKGLAQRAIDKVRFLAQPIELPPMSPHERRIIHLTVSEQEDVLSESVGEDRERRVVVKLKKSN